jgi:predicted nucleic acid-binding protein
VILVDANLLLYAYHPRAEQHEKSRPWLEAALSGPDLVRFAWLTLWAFLRISTNARVFDRLLSTSEAEAAISSWLAQPVAGILEPGDSLMREGQATGPAGDGRCPRRYRNRAWRHPVHDRPRFFTVLRA